MSDGSFLWAAVEGTGFGFGEAVFFVVVVAVAAGLGMSRDSFLEHLGHKLARLLRRAPRAEVVNDPEKPRRIRQSRWLSWLSRLSGVLLVRFAIWLFITGFTGFLAWNYFLPRMAATPIGPIAWNFDNAAKGAGWFLGMFKTNNQEIRVLGFSAHGRNITKNSINHLTGWMRSDVTNVSKPIYILGQDDDDKQLAACILRVPTSYDETYGIPALADFDIVTFPFVGFTQTDGISAATFLNTFAPFTVHIEYDGAIAHRQFSKEEIQKQIDVFGEILSLQNIPRVIRRENAAKPKLRAIQPLVNATPVPVPGHLSPITPNDEFDPSPTGSMIQRPKSNGNSN
jgi:hypothetical protein